MKAAIAAAVEIDGRLDILIANAGGHGVGPTMETTDDQWALATKLSLDTVFVCARECLPELIKSKGNIVIVASIAGLFAGPSAHGYVTMKHGCIGLGKSLARDFGRYGVRTNMIFHWLSQCTRSSIKKRPITRGHTSVQSTTLSGNSPLYQRRHIPIVSKTRKKNDRSW